MGQVDQIRSPVDGSGGRALNTHQAVGTKDALGLLADGHIRRLGGLEAQDSPPTVSVDRRGWATQDFRTPERPDIEMVQGGLSVCEGCRNPVDQDLEAAHTKLRPRARATHGNSLPDGVVVAILDLNARKTLQGLFQRKAGVPEL